MSLVGSQRSKACRKMVVIIQQPKLKVVPPQTRAKKQKEIAL